MGLTSTRISPSDQFSHHFFLPFGNQLAEIQIQRLPCARAIEMFLLVYHFLLEQKRCLLVVFLNNVIDDAPSRVRCVEEAFYSSAMADHSVPILLFQDLLPFISIIKLSEFIPHCGGEDNILCTSGTSEFSEGEEIAVLCCGHPQTNDALHIHNSR